MSRVYFHLKLDDEYYPDPIGEQVSDLEPIREVWIHDEGFAAASRLSMMRIIARRMKAMTVAV